MSTALLRALLIALCVMLGAQSAAAPVPAELGAAVAAGRARVLVALQLPTDQPADKRAIADLASDVLAALPAEHYTLRRRYSSLPALALEIDAQALERLAAHPDVAGLALDLGGTGAMLEAAPLAGVAGLRALGLDGRGLRVAVIDSGITRVHADFAGRIVAEQCFCSAASGSGGCCPNGRPTQSGSGAATDEHGHGTNVSGILAGAGVVAPPGVLPAAEIVAVRVLDRNNRFCCLSDVLAALDWVRNEQPGVRVINASLGTSSLYADDCDSASASATLTASAVAQLRQNGTLLVASAGNQRDGNAMALPACVRDTVSVGATWDLNAATLTVLQCTDAPVSPHQATCFGNSSATTDVYAPGALITSSGISGGTATFAGTSQASPIVAGCAGALMQAATGASLDQILAALRHTPARVTEPKNGRSYPRLDCADALSAVRFLDQANHSGFYSASAHPGYALYLTHQDDTIAVAWYTYAENARPVWFTAATTRQPDGSYRGDYLQSSGTPLPLIQGSPALLSSRVRGQLSLHFRDSGLLDVGFVPTGGAPQQRVLEALAYAQPTPVCRYTLDAREGASNHTDLWWNPAENGWGLGLAEQGEAIFLAWYSYAGDGEPQWLTGLLARQADGSFQGALNRALEGTPYTLLPDGALTSFPLPVVGQARLRFADGSHGSFDYQVDGHSRSVAIERYAFGAVRQLCQ
ncbi:MAG: S8 family serine peptidase [Lysobacterales bacterium]